MYFSTQTIHVKRMHTNCSKIYECTQGWKYQSSTEAMWMASLLATSFRRHCIVSLRAVPLEPKSDIMLWTPPFTSLHHDEVETLIKTVLTVLLQILKQRWNDKRIYQTPKTKISNNASLFNWEPTSLLQA